MRSTGRDVPMVGAARAGLPLANDPHTLDDQAPTELQDALAAAEPRGLLRAASSASQFRINQKVSPIARKEVRPLE